jgi:hypothetical protein
MAAVGVDGSFSARNVPSPSRLARAVVFPAIASDEWSGCVQKFFRV